MDELTNMLKLRGAVPPDAWCADVLEFLLSYIWEHGEKVEKQTLGRGWTMSTGSSIIKYVLSAEADLDRITVHGAE